MLTSENERRTFDRYAYDGAVVRLLEGKYLGLLKKFSTDYPMKDISRSGMRLELDQYKGPGTFLNLIIDIPGKSNIQMFGNVRWIADHEEANNYEIGILFSPYGSRKEYNPVRHKGKLKNMLKKRDIH